jgi:hypothetical protein
MLQKYKLEGDFRRGITMRKSVSLYTRLINSIAHICDDTSDIEIYNSTLSSEDQSKYDILIDDFLDEQKILLSCRRRRKVYENYSELHSLANDFQTFFPDFPGLNIAELIFIITISQKLASLSTEIPQEEVSKHFSLFEASLQFPSKAFVSNISTLKDNLIWVNPTCKDSLNSLLAFETDIELWYVLLTIVDKIDFNSGNEIVVCRSDCVSEGGNNANVISLLKLHIMSSNKQISQLNTYSEPPRNSSIDNFCPKRGYSQFDEVIKILGEYVNREDALSKYLSLYHVVENFMYRKPIVELERSNQGAMFSIRDFRRLYVTTEEKESPAIKKLIKSSFPLNIAGLQFDEFAHRHWRAFLTNQSGILDEVEHFFKKLSLNLHRDSNRQTFLDILHSVVYKTRCSIVHNKETEHHISSENYGEGCKAVIEELLLPLMEELVFLLLAKENDFTWYESDSIKLWERA